VLKAVQYRPPSLVVVVVVVVVVVTRIYKIKRLESLVTA